MDRQEENSVNKYRGEVPTLNFKSTGEEQCGAHNTTVIKTKRRSN